MRVMRDCSRSSKTTSSICSSIPIIHCLNNSLKTLAKTELLSKKMIPTICSRFKISCLSVSIYAPKLNIIVPNKSRMNQLKSNTSLTAKQTPKSNCLQFLLKSMCDILEYLSSSSRLTSCTVLCIGEAFKSQLSKKRQTRSLIKNSVPQWSCFIRSCTLFSWWLVAPNQMKLLKRIGKMQTYCAPSFLGTMLWGSVCLLSKCISRTNTPCNSLKISSASRILSSNTSKNSQRDEC